VSSIFLNRVSNLNLTKGRILEKMIRWILVANTINIIDIDISCIIYELLVNLLAGCCVIRCIVFIVVSAIVIRYVLFHDFPIYSMIESNLYISGISIPFPVSHSISNHNPLQIELEFSFLCSIVIQIYLVC
jgi:hypothetical protein